MKERLFIFDTTLRDGAQTRGIDFSTAEKRRIATLLDRLGVDYVEGGYPSANPTDDALFAKPPVLQRAALVAFGMTKRAGRSADNDTALQGVIRGAEFADTVCLVGKASNYHAETALGISPEENIQCIADSMNAVVNADREAIFDAEHFFDGFKANPDYALACVQTALHAGATWVILCDTNGGTLPSEVARIVREVTQRIPGDKVGIHAHNDTGNAIANTLTAVDAGARHIQGTLNGLGERCGNADLCALLPTLLLKDEYAKRFATGITQEALKTLTGISRALDEILNRAPAAGAAYVGTSAFAHKGGIHVSAVRKDPRTYEHAPPESVGNRRDILVSGQAGRSNLLSRLQLAGITLKADDLRLVKILSEVKEKEAMGCSYDGAEASFELMARRMLGEMPEFFTVEEFRVLVRGKADASGSRVFAEAVTKVRVDGERFLSVAEGDGPVNALDLALRKDLGKYTRHMDDLFLADFKVRILTTGTEAITRVVVESHNGKGERWHTVGVSANIVEASLQALLDSIFYKLLQDKAPHPI